MVEDLELLRSAIGEEKLTLFGHSFGSMLALAYYKAHPEHVERIVLTGAFPPSATIQGLVTAMRPRQMALKRRPAVARTLAREGLSGPDESLSARQQSYKRRIVGLAALNVIDLRRWREVVGGGVFYSQLVDQRVAASIKGQLEFSETVLRHPVAITIVQGDRDYIDPGASEWVTFMRKHPSSPIVVKPIRSASHYAWIDDPIGFASGLAMGLRRTK